MVSNNPPKSVQERLDAVRGRIAAAAIGAGREPQAITLVAVSKRKPVRDIVTAYEAGQRDFGENYVQEFAAKAAAMPVLPNARFHLIGNLQSNKAKRAASLFTTIHTVDRAKIVRRLDRYAKPLEVFLEVKLSREANKAGMQAGMVSEVLESVRRSENLEIVGLMTMPPWDADPERSRPYFRKLRELAAEHGLGGLSMGMSHDLEVAIEEGATHVRVGTAIFGRRVPA